MRWSHDNASTTVSDGFGFFKINKAEIGDTLVVSMMGFETVGWVYNGESYVDIPLKAGVELASAEVIEKKAATELSLLSPLDVQSLNRKELVKAACCNLRGPEKLRGWSWSFQVGKARKALCTDRYS